MPARRDNPVLPGLRARMPLTTRSVAWWAWPPMTTSAPHPASSCPSCSSLVSGAIPGPSSACGDACTPSTAVPPGSRRRSWAGRSSRTPSRPACSRTPRVQPMCDAIAAYRSTRSVLLAASATVAGCSPVRTYRSVFRAASRCRAGRAAAQAPRRAAGRTGHDPRAPTSGPPRSGPRPPAPRGAPRIAVNAGGSSQLHGPSVAAPPCHHRITARSARALGGAEDSGSLRALRCS